MKYANKSLSLNTGLLVFMLLVCFGLICMINFFAPPSFYDSDMYTDIRYATEAWEHKSIFPEGWVFGNQLYVISTPVLASLFYGLTGLPKFSMGLASTVMTVLVLLSFSWMIQPIIKSREARLAGILIFLTVVLFFGDAWNTTSGWQLLFTMCSYYACYAISAFLSFGCYIRSSDPTTCRFVIMLVLSCILSFGTGIQSLRQTAVMTLPLLGMEFLNVVWHLYKKRPINRNSMLVAGTLSAANILGLIVAGYIDLEQVEIIGQLNLIAPRDLFQNLRLSILLALSLIMNHDISGVLVLVCIVIICTAAFLGILGDSVRQKNEKTIIMAGLLFLSILAILAVDTLTTMQVRSIYYFMIFPLIAFLAAWLFFKVEKWRKTVFLVLLSALFVCSCCQAFPSAYSAIRDAKEEEAYEISNYLQENGYTTLYGAWNQGADIAIASDWEISAGFWEYQENPFFFYKYLCNPDVFRADSRSCVYLFYGKEDARLGVEKAKTKNIDMKLIQYFPESDAYLYTAPVNIMEVFW